MSKNVSLKSMLLAVAGLAVIITGNVISSKQQDIAIKEEIAKQVSKIINSKD